MPYLPAICNNPKCKSVFASAFFIGGTNNVMNLAGGVTGPCPNCGSDGLIPDGQYSTISSLLVASIEKFDDVARLTGLFDLIDKAFEAGVAPDEIKDQVSKEAPELQSVWDLVPTKRSEAYTAIGLILALLSLLITNFESCKSGSIEQHQKQIIDQSYDNLYRMDIGSKIIDKPKSSSLPSSKIEKQAD